MMKWYSGRDDIYNSQMQNGARVIALLKKAILIFNNCFLRQNFWVEGSIPLRQLQETSHRLIEYFEIIIYNL